MAIRDYVAKVLAFRTVPTTVSAICIYLALLLAVTITDELPNVPKNQLGLNITQADLDLHVITARPHPFVSHYNDKVHSYILSRVQTVASSHPSSVHVIDDTVSNASWAMSARGAPFAVYFQATNILVKIDGTDQDHTDKDAVLFDAHYDSVSTAGGTTDDGMGVVTLLQMVEYLANNRPKRTAVFNFNNGEEDGLNGAHAFLEHPWSNITTTFLNLEGAAAGGRPLLFRSTSLAPTRAFKHEYVAHPHTNVISADGFAAGVVRSGTDFSVYAQEGMEGLDFAFYKGRSRYHTKYDSVPFTEGGRKALWAMMESTRGAGLALLNEGGPMKGGGNGVYFDVLGSRLVSVSLRAVFVSDVVLLVLGPISLTILGLLIYAKRQRARANALLVGERVQSKSKSKMFRGWGRFFTALVVGVAAEVGVVVGYVKLNPFIIHSAPYVVLASTLSLAYLSTLLPLQLFARFLPVPPAKQKFALMVEMYVLTWVLLVGATVLADKSQIGGGYWVTVWNIGALAACMVGCVEALAGTGRAGLGEERESRVSVRGVRFEVGDGQGAAEENGEHRDRDRETGGEEEVVDDVPTEITPLMNQRRMRTRDGVEYVTGDDQGKQPASLEVDRAIGWWIAQMLLLVVAPVLLILQIALLLLGTLGQTLVDGSSSRTVYAVASSLSFLAILPLTPFMHKMHRSVTYVALSLFILSTAYAWLAFPFSQEAPLKLYFQQSLELDIPGHGSRAVTRLTGPKYYLEKMVLSDLPSTWGKAVTCGASNTRLGLWLCEWEGGLYPEPGSSDDDASVVISKNESISSVRESESSPPDTAASRWLTLKTTRVDNSSARFFVRGVNTRGCRLYFDSSPIKSFDVYDLQNREKRTEMQKGYEVPDGGLNELRLWSREWEQGFVVEVGLQQQEGELQGRAACEWAEYESGTAGAGLPGTGAKIPALEEVLTFLPKWATVTKENDGLVEAWTRFSA